MSENKFTYTYSAPTESEKREINSIRRQYEPQSEKELKLKRLRSLDSKVKNPPQIVALILGIIGLLIFGLGFALVLEWGYIVLGILAALVGLIPMIAAFPSYKYFYEKQKNKYSEEILSLTKELLNEG